VVPVYKGIGKRTRHERRVISACFWSGERRVRSEWCGPRVGALGVGAENRVLAPASSGRGSPFRRPGANNSLFIKIIIVGVTKSL
jgi:hypothetical protein